MDDIRQLLAPTHWAVKLTEAECLAKYRRERAMRLKTMHGGGISQLRREEAIDSAFMRKLAGL